MISTCGCCKSLRNSSAPAKPDAPNKTTRALAITPTLAGPRSSDKALVRIRSWFAPRWPQCLASVASFTTGFARPGLGFHLGDPDVLRTSQVSPRGFARSVLVLHLGG